MDANRFDALSRYLGVPATRRGASALGAALVAALALPDTGSAQVQAEMCIKPGQRCKKKQGKHRKKMRCCGKARCRKGRCRCKQGFQSCQGKCIRKTECCGGCLAGQTCVNGQCTGCETCPAGQACVNDQCVGCGQGGDCTTFATSTLHTGNLGGLTGADAICQQRAGVAGLSGTYKAWLSDATGSPAARFTQNPGRYVRTDGLPIAANWTALVSGSLAVPIDRTETGQYVADDREAWSNTATNGTPYSADPNLICGEWSSGSLGLSGRVGETDEVDDDWTSSHSDPCDNAWRLYCFQQG
ncbi:MAG: DUF1554 domain-containing protein [Chloroflexota bacterium]|nr:DUF1554 domain-containing protein [Chloroflexota bacterium]